MTRTEEKLGEAKFFLKKLQANYRTQPDFDNYLNAFINAARSIVWIMRAEYSKTPGWEEWYDSSKPTDEEKDFLEKVNKLRVQSTKQSSLRTKTMIGFEVPPDFLTDDLKQLFQKMQSKEIEVKATILRRIESFEGKSTKVEGDVFSTVLINPEPFREMQSFPGEDALAICADYYELLKELVDKCRQKFYPDKF